MSAGAITLVRTTSPSRYISIGACVCVCESRKVVTIERQVKAMMNCVVGLSQLSGRAKARAATLRARVRRVVKMGRRRRLLIQCLRRNDANFSMLRDPTEMLNVLAALRTACAFAILCFIRSLSLLMLGVRQIARENFAG